VGMKHSMADLERRLASGTVSEKQTVYAILADAKLPDVDHLLAQQLDALLAGKVADAVRLDLLDAAAKHSDPEIKAKLAEFARQRADKPVLAQFEECLTGGNAANGRKIFREKVEASCIRCHKVAGEGGDAGPDLSKIAARASREYMLESIVLPHEKIAPGYENVQGQLNNGVSYAGLLKAETADTLQILSPEDGLMTLKKSDIKTRVRGLSGMLNNMKDVLSKRDIRDLVEYLAQLK